MKPLSELTLSDFDFSLPPELIAQTPSVERSGARLLDATGESPKADANPLRLVDRHVRDLPELLAEGDLLVVNDTKVIQARLFGAKDTGGALELLVERVLPDLTVHAHLRASKSPRAGQGLTLGGDRGAPAFQAEVLGRAGPDNALFHLRFDGNPWHLLEQHGHVPLPPYITHADNDDDVRRYQTVFARQPGAVAAPTAALHLDEALLARIAARGVQLAQVTLHVGAGTFQPVRVERLAEHRMHHEWFDVPQATVDAIAATRARGGRVVAIGTTTVRALESAAQQSLANPNNPGGALMPMQGDTSIFITPGHSFAVVDRLLTNFHLPKSTLLMLVAAFSGRERMQAIYAHAIAQRYRFFSYGDAMLLDRVHGA